LQSYFLSLYDEIGDHIYGKRNEKGIYGREKMAKEILVAQERREYKRYRVKDGAYALDAARSGLICDIGLGGMSFLYVERKNWPEDSFLLDIVFGEDEDFRLDRLPYRIICEEECKDTEAESAKLLKRRSIAFDHLSDQQIEKLKDFIIFNTVAEA
jgi:hypothetical protein